MKTPMTVSATPAFAIQMAPRNASVYRITISVRPMLLTRRVVFPTVIASLPASFLFIHSSHCYASVSEAGTVPASNHSSRAFLIFAATSAGEHPNRAASAI